MHHDEKLEMLDGCKQEYLKWSIKVHEAKARLAIAGLQAERDRLRELYSIMLEFAHESDSQMI